uniref:Uncharacterized protein n=1 Tax=uncultured marine virus TaxID=186617 RepID=A0A0F7L4N1_9VIRU|nr:hypothetical protein [uncultured marine virus]
MEWDPVHAWHVVSAQLDFCAVVVAQRLDVLLTHGHNIAGAVFDVFLDRRTDPLHRFHVGQHALVTGL